MEQTLSTEEKEYLRALAQKQREYALLPRMEENKRRWYAHNDLKGELPMVTVEIRTFEQDVLPPPRCKNKIARIIEHKLLAVITGYELTRDDRVVPAFYSIVPEVEFVPFSIDLIKQMPKSSNGQKVTYAIEPVINDLPSQLPKLGASSYRFDKQQFDDERELAEDIFGDILPTCVQCPPLSCFISKVIVELMGMESMMYAFYDYPDEMKELVCRVTDEYMAYFDYLERGGFLTWNNDNVLVKMGTLGFTGDLACGQLPVTTKQLWGHLNSQETSSVSPEVFKEFFFEAYARAASRFGLYTYGCCEPVHPVWDNCLSKMPVGMRKLSISPWCDEEIMGERLRGANIIFHRKPSPNFLGVGEYLDEDAFCTHIRSTLQAARGCKLEFSFRDIYTLSGHTEKPARAVELVRRLIEENWK